MVFKFLHKRVSPKPFEQLIVSQFNAIQFFTEKIDRKIENAKSGKAKIVIKVNNLQERQMIEKLYAAAAAGVEVILIARSICCLVPGTNGIRVYSGFIKKL